MHFTSRTSPDHLRSIDEILGDMLSAERIAAARMFFDSAAQSIPHIARLKTTPQTLPKHGEGDFVVDHVVRMLAIVDAIKNGASLKDCDIIGNNPVIRLALHDAEGLVRESPEMFKAYALMHNVAKPDRLLLVAAPGTVGEKEGFVVAEKRSSEYTTSSELARFDKLRRAGLAKDIEATFESADKAVIAPEYADVREAIVKFCGLEGAYVKFVMELCWSHADVESFFVFPGNESAFLTFAARAGKAGINVERYLNALFSIALIDHVLGRTSFVNDGDRVAVDLGVFHRFVTAEHEAMPERFAAREARLAHAKKIRVKAILAENGLDPEEIFTMLGTPLGSERGVVMHEVYKVIRAESAGEYFGVHADVIIDRAMKAASALAHEGLSV